MNNSTIIHNDEAQGTFSDQGIEKSIHKLIDIYDKKEEYLDKEITVTLQYLKKESIDLENFF